jgi:pilus assembly protein Flp/PilA
MFQFLFKHLSKDQKGQDLAEDGLLIGLIALAVIISVGLLGDGLDATFNAIAETVNSW